MTFLRKAVRLAFVLSLTALPISWVSTYSSMQQHERLRVRNDFKTPEEVVNYYCARDASGFVWSGLLDIERRLFTLWKQVPQAESFLVAKHYQLKPTRKSASSADTATIEVSYDVVGTADAQGAMVPASKKDYSVTFTLRKISGQWKIESPTPDQISPVVLESKFPFMAAK